MNLYTESEELILKILWEKGYMSVMQIVKELQEITGWSKQSVISFLRRMEKKGTVSYELRERTKYYYAVIQKENVVKEETKGILNRFFGGRVGAMVSYMASENNLSDKDIKELKALIEELENHDR